MLMASIKIRYLGACSVTLQKPNENEYSHRSSHLGVVAQVSDYKRSGGPRFKSHCRCETLGRSLCHNCLTSGVIGVQLGTGREGICVCVACRADLEVQLGGMLPRELCGSFERAGQ
jgi:hypothetical protein